MTTSEVQQLIKKIIVDKSFGIEMFATLQKEDNYELKKFQINDDLHNVVKNKLFEILSMMIDSDDFNLMSIQNIDEKVKTYYEIVQTDRYKPFHFLNVELPELPKYLEKEQQSLKGFCIKINRNDSFFWIYQHKYSTTLINRSTSIFAILNGSVYEPLDCDVIKLESKIDFVVIGDSIITKNVNLLQSSFGFEDYVRAAATKTIEAIKNIDIISDMSKLIDLTNRTKLTFAKKLMKATKSPVLQVPKDELLNKVKTLDYYSKHIKIDETTKKIILSSQKDVREFLKMLNDEILKSELTGNDYESSAKEKIDIQNNDN